MLNWLSIDVCAALAGVLCAVIAFYSTKPEGGDVASVAVGFASGSAAFLLAVSAVSLFLPNSYIFDALRASNKVLMFGALGYAAFINLRTVPGVLTLFNGRRGQNRGP